MKSKSISVNYDEKFKWRIFFQEKGEFQKSSIWLQFYASSSKDTFLTHPVEQKPLV